MSLFTTYTQAILTKAVTWAGVPFTRRKILDFWGAGVEEVTDDPVNGRTRVKISAGAGATDHGALTGLTDDDHTQYPLRTGSTLSGTFTWTGGNVDVQAGTVLGLNVRRGAGDPNGSITAARGTIWQRTDGTGQHYVNTDDATTWVQLAAGGLALTSTAPLAVGGATSLGSSSDAMKGDAKPDIGVKGANIASAATINLDTATGDYVHITGTEPIGAITLAQGLSRTTIFDDACLLTHSASLLLNNGGANITTEAGGWMFCRGEGAGVTRGMYFRADGSSLQLATTTDVLTGTDFTKAATSNAIAALWEDNATDITDGATITIGEGGSFNLITSVVSVTAFVFTTSKAGRKVVCRFGTVRTLTHAAALALPNAGNNITTAVGDLCEVEDRGSGNVRVNWYTRADGTALVGGDDGLSILSMSPTSTSTYTSTFDASWDLSSLVPANCVVKCTVHWCVGKDSGDTSDAVPDMIAEQRLLATYNGGALLQVQHLRRWLTPVYDTVDGPWEDASIQYSVVSAIRFSNNASDPLPNSQGFLTADATGGVVHSYCETVEQAGMKATAKLVIDLVHTRGAQLTA